MDPREHVHGATNTDVLVVGAGPAGLMCALALATYGVRTTVVERRVPEQIHGNADVIQPGTNEIWASFGLHGQLMREGHAVYTYVSYSTNDETGQLERQNWQGPSVSVSDTRFPYEVSLPIEKIERILRDASEARGVLLEQPWTPAEMVLQDDPNDELEYPVKVTLERPPNCGHEPSKKVINAKYIIGCDGSRSWVREQANIQMEKTERNDQAVNWVVLTFTPETDFPDKSVKSVISAPGACGLIFWVPRPDGKARLYIPVEDLHLGDTQADSREELVNKMQAIVNSAFQPFMLHITKCEWIGTYKVLQSVARSFSSGDRLFLAGDAAHTHSAKTGQGANAAMRDSYNIAWKLAYVLKGWAKPTLLATYDEECRQHALELITLDREIAAALEQKRSDEYKRLWEEKNRLITGVGISYRSSPLTPTAQPSPLAQALVPGERIPPAQILRLSDWHPSNLHELLVSDGSFKVLLFPGAIRDSTTAVDNFTRALYRVLDRGKAPSDKLLSIFAVFSDSKHWVHWTDAPLGVRDTQSVFVDDSIPSLHEDDISIASGGLYERFQVTSEGCAVLLRPDALISLVCPINFLGAHTVSQYLTGL